MADELTLLSARMDRFEVKLDRMIEAITALARMEERMAAHMDGMQRMGNRIDRMDERLEQIEHRIDELEQSKVRFATMVGVISGGAGLLAPVAFKFVFGV